MSILIKGMEIPEKCEKCDLCFLIKGEHFCQFLYEPVNFEIEARKRSEYCPLIPVPPHGRLIEETAAIETAWMILTGLGYLKDENPHLEQTVREVFATAPAIEVE